MARKDYSKIALTPQQIEAGEHRNHLGGGPREWRKRGAFQLALLQWLGLQPQDTLLDVGCGPLRGGIHLMEFLQRGNYRGVDFNASFIEAAHALLEQEHLSPASSQVSVLQEFDFASLGRTFDFIFCFSVLNHCSDGERALFFERVPTVMTPRSRLVITHAGWFDASADARLPVAVSNTYASESQLAPDLKFSEWGFGAAGDRLPIMEFRLAG